MCLIALQVDKKLSKEDFDKIWSKNPDGCGFAKLQNNKAYFHKGFMDKELAWKRHEAMELPFTTHMRKASIGAKIPELTHPFIISKESPLELEGETDKDLLFMNGTCVLWEEYLAASNRYPEKDEIISDARAISMIIAPDNHTPDNHNHRFLYKLRAKFAVLSVKDNQTFYYQGKDFTKENGIFYSNLEWRHEVYTLKKKETQKISTIPTIIFHEKNSHIGQNGQNSGLTYNLNHNWKKPWVGNTDPKKRVFRYLLDKVSEKAAKKLWDTYHKNNGKSVEWACEKAMKILKQQDKNFTIEKERRIKRFMEADLFGFPENIYHLRSGGIKTYNLEDDYVLKTEEQQEKQEDREGFFLGC